eukprot:3468670-Rhodomonas_salina.2
MGSEEGARERGGERGSPGRRGGGREHSDSARKVTTQAGTEHVGPKEIEGGRRLKRRSRTVVVLVGELQPEIAAAPARDLSRGRSRDNSPARTGAAGEWIAPSASRLYPCVFCLG